MLDSKGRPATGFTFQLHGKINTEGKRWSRRDPLELPEIPGYDDFWHGWSWPDSRGKIAWQVPRGLDDAGISLSGLGADGEYVLRSRIGKDQALRAGGDVQLGPLDRDVKEIEIVRYLCPTIRVKLEGRDGAKPRNVEVTARYPEGLPVDPFLEALGKDSSEVHFAETDYGRFLSRGLLAGPNGDHPRQGRWLPGAIRKPAVGGGGHQGSGDGPGQAVTGAGRLH